MSVTCTQPDPDASSSIASPGRTTSDTTARDAVVLGDPAGIGYTVVLPEVVDDVQAAMEAITARTPFIAYRRSADERTTYDSVDKFLEEHPDGEALRPILDQYFNHSD